MLIIGVTIVRNESDVIEAFVRHNLRFLDELQVIDNASTDTTWTILTRLAQELDGVVLGSSAHRDHRQESIFTAVMQQLSRDAEFDFAIPLDADEFIHSDSRKTFEDDLAKIARGEMGALPWVTYVPMPDDDWTEPDLRRRITHRRVTEPSQTFKVVIPHALALDPTFRLVPGSHDAIRGDVDRVPWKILETTSLAHFPVRSPDQLISKALLGEWALSMKLGRGKNEGEQWRKLTSRFARNPTISREELCKIAVSYDAKEAADHVLDPLGICEDTRLKWPHLIDVDVLKRVVQFTSSHFKGLSRTPFETDFMAINRTADGVIGYHQTDTVIGRSIRLCGEWAADELRLLTGLVASGDNIIDVGANIGTHAVALAARVGPAGLVHAFEPQRLIYQMLCANAALNGLTNIVAHLAGVGEKAGTAMIPRTDLAKGGNFGEFRLQQNVGDESVPIVTLDELILPRVRLIKIDVESMEKQVLLGSSALIARDRPLIFAENNIPENSEALIQALFDLGYLCWWHFADYYNPNNFYGRQENIFSRVDRPEINLLCMHESTLVPMVGLAPVVSAGETWQEGFRRQPGKLGA